MAPMGNVKPAKGIGGLANSAPKLIDVWTSVPEAVGLSNSYWREEEQTYHKANVMLCQEGFNVVSCHMTFNNSFQFNRDGVEYKCFSVDDKQAPLRSQMSTPLLDFICRSKPDLLIVHLLNRAMTDLCLSFHAENVKRILHVNTFSLAGSTQAFLQTHPEALHGVIATAPSLAKALIHSWRLPTDLVIALPSAIDLNTFSGGGNKNKAWDLVWTGQLRLDDEKRVEEIVTVAYRANASLLVVGDGDKRGHIEKAAAICGIRFKCVGWVPNAAVKEHLCKAKVYMTTAMRDPCPRSVTEALACGLPIVAYEKALGLELQVIHGENGLLCSSAESMATDVRALLNDPNRIRSMGERSAILAESIFAPGSRHAKLTAFLKSRLETSK